jgi:hypothetical protein
MAAKVVALGMSAATVGVSESEAVLEEMEAVLEEMEAVLEEGEGGRGAVLEERERERAVGSAG